MLRFACAVHGVPAAASSDWVSAALRLRTQPKGQNVGYPSAGSVEAASPA